MELVLLVHGPVDDVHDDRTGMAQLRVVGNLHGIGAVLELLRFREDVLDGQCTFPWWVTCRPLLEEDEEWGDGYDRRCGCCPPLLGSASLIPEYGPEDPAHTTGEVPTVYCVHLDAQTGIVVDVTALGGIGGSSLPDESHAVDGPLDAPL